MFEHTGKGQDAGPLAQVTGEYLERPAPRSLRDSFACVWTHRMPLAPVRQVVIVPDATIDLQWLDGKFRIAGPDSSVQQEIVAAGATVVGFRFRPAVATAWLGASAEEFRDRRVALEDIWGMKARNMAAAVRDHLEAEGIVGAIEAVLARFGPECAAADAAMRAAYTLVAEGPPSGIPLVPWLGRALGMSERTLRRRFDESFGYGPKTLDRILRHQRFLRLAGTEGVSTAMLAAEAGYSDQAHLVRESRRLTGSTPLELRRALRADACHRPSAINSC
ncbi:transcriptional regulator [Mesorhizobium sp. L-8-10]|uniref:helix-turn-helix domain-containing protein n=1 Tax=Mesorhizobium sp. L-8-10 TaxID=2744523 RepID=UPI0019278C63|nr:AraC family transcriptional regulator [Mesorhizobium sp. L-8-10]BCH33054.1 transcriptional regulator [Mesorhizobium sp. L-8-10]